MIEVTYIPKEEQETTITFYRGDEMIDVYSSDNTVITKLKKITKEENIKVLSVSKNNTITAGVFRIDRKQLSFRTNKE